MLAWSPPELFRQRMLYVVSVLLYVANWAMVLGLPLYALAHTWSLAIEEQFYLLWPPALSLLMRRVRHRVPIVLIVVAGISVAIIWRSLLMSRGASTPRLFLGLDTRADSVLIGCALAMMLTWNMAPRLVGGVAGRKWVPAVAVAALCVLFATARFPAAFRDYFASTLTALAAGLLIIHLLTPSSRLARFFETRPLVGLGRISYGLYLWHFPIFLGLGVLVSRSTGFDPVRLALAWVLSFAVSLLSFRFIEQPALRLKAKWER
jgi:peptidoglycan/LPS O-acetylase OafA/YrhL